MVRVWNFFLSIETFLMPLLKFKNLLTSKICNVGLEGGGVYFS
jgi:hypothetical protein